MYLNTLTGKFKKMGLALSLVLGLMLLSSAAVQAQYRDRDYGRYPSTYGNQMYRVAQDFGYRDGLNKGAEDARDRDRYNAHNAKDYKKATNGYNSGYRNKDAYKQAYRDAFLRGYDEGYNRYGYDNRNNRNNRRYGNDGIIEALRRIIIGY